MIATVPTPPDRVSFTKLSQWLAYLEQVHWQEMELGLGRVGEVARRMGLLEPSCPVITVAGTNGKGSTVAALEQLALACGRSVGSFTSPHILQFNERIRLNGQALNDADLCAAFAAIEHARGDISLSYFEFATLAALWCFARQSLDLIVLEVGLGGRLDAVNIIAADVAIITNVQLDHQQWLGPDRASIAREKAGIARPGKPVVLAEQELAPGLRQLLDEMNCQVVCLGEHYHMQGQGVQHCRYVDSARGVGWQLPAPALAPESVAAAIQAVLICGWPLTAEQAARAIACLCLPGRFQQLCYQGRQIVLDVAHNPAALARLAQRLQQQRVSGKTHAIFAMMADKDVAASVACLAGAIDGNWWPLALTGPRALPGEAMQALLQATGIANVRTAALATELLPAAVAACGANDRIVVCGSFYTVAALLPLLQPGDCSE